MKTDLMLKFKQNTKYLNKCKNWSTSTFTKLLNKVVEAISRLEMTKAEETGNSTILIYKLNLLS